MTSESGDTFEETSTSEELVVEASWETTVEVDDILWTHENISPCFAGNARGQHRGMSITRLVYDVLFGQVQIQDVDKIKVVQFGGKLWTLTGNRRLWVFKTVKELSYLPRLYIPVCMVKMKLSQKIMKIMFNNRNGGRTVGFEIVSCTTTKKRRDLRHEPLVLTMDEKRIICGRKQCAADENCVYHRRFLKQMGNPCYRRHNHPEWRRAFRLVTERRRRFAQLPEEVQQAIKRREMQVEIEWRASFRHRKFEWKDSKKECYEPIQPDNMLGKAPMIGKLPCGKRMVLRPQSIRPQSIRPQSSCCWSASVISDIKRARSSPVANVLPRHHAQTNVLPRHHSETNSLPRHRSKSEQQRKKLLVSLREEIRTLRRCLKSSHVQLREMSKVKNRQKIKSGSKVVTKDCSKPKSLADDLPEQKTSFTNVPKVNESWHSKINANKRKLEQFHIELVSLRKAAEELECDIGFQQSLVH